MGWRFIVWMWHKLFVVFVFHPNIIHLGMHFKGQLWGMMKGSKDFKSSLMVLCLWCCLGVLVILIISCGEGRKYLHTWNLKEDFHYKSSHIIGKILLIKLVAQFLPLLTHTLLTHTIMYSLLCLQIESVMIEGL